MSETEPARCGCGHVLSPHARFCRACGAARDGRTAAPLSPPTIARDALERLDVERPAASEPLLASLESLVLRHEVAQRADGTGYRLATRSLTLEGPHAIAPVCLACVLPAVGDPVAAIRVRGADVLEAELLHGVAVVRLDGETIARVQLLAGRAESAAGSPLFEFQPPHARRKGSSVGRLARLLERPAPWPIRRHGAIVAELRVRRRSDALALRGEAPAPLVTTRRVLPTEPNFRAALAACALLARTGATHA